jgi:hypothetical protein
LPGLNGGEVFCENIVYILDEFDITVKELYNRKKKKDINYDKYF